MTREETKKFLKEISALYPSVENKASDPSLTVDLWNEICEGKSYSQMHKALIKYFKTDETGFAPTYYKLVGEDEVPNVIRDESIEDWN